MLVPLLSHVGLLSHTMDASQVETMSSLGSSVALEWNCEDTEIWQEHVNSKLWVAKEEPSLQRKLLTLRSKLMALLSRPHCVNNNLLLILREGDYDPTQYLEYGMFWVIRGGLYLLVHILSAFSFLQRLSPWVHGSQIDHSMYLWMWVKQIISLLLLTSNWKLAYVFKLNVGYTPQYY